MSSKFGGMNMTDKKTAVEKSEELDVTKAWQATQDQEGKAKKLRIFAWVSWLVAIGTEIFGVLSLLKGKFDQGNLALLIGILVVIAVFAIAGSLLWKAANKQDPASEADKFKFFVQNQLGAIMTLLAFLPLIVLIFMDKDMDPKNKKIAGGIGAALAVIATMFGVSFDPPSVEQYTQDMNTCAAQIKANDVVYWIAPKAGAERSSAPLVFHLCEDVSPLRGKNVNSGSVTEAYAQNAASNKKAGRINTTCFTFRTSNKFCMSRFPLRMSYKYPLLA